MSARFRRLYLSTSSTIYIDEVFLILHHLSVLDTSVFPDERQRLQLAVLILLSAYTATRPCALVYTVTDRVKQREHYLGWENDDHDDNDEMDLDWEDIQTLCYEDVTLLMLPSPGGKRDLLAMEVTLKYTKGWKKRPNPVPWSIAENKKFTITDEDRQYLATSQATGNLIRDVRAIVDGLNQTRPLPANASLAAYLEGVSTVTQLALSNELHYGNPTAVREIIADLVSSFGGAPIPAGQPGVHWDEQGGTVGVQDLKTVLLDQNHDGWLNASMIQALLFMMTHIQFEGEASMGWAGAPRPGYFVVSSESSTAWRTWTGPTAQSPQRPSTG
ncbi:hypothetical protein RBB50_012866 [Rhinocladiella similis]